MPLRIGAFHFPDLSGGYPLELTEEERRELVGLESKVGELQRQKVSRFRELARQKGASALKLEDLKSECGEPFIEEKERDSYQRAVAQDKTKPHRYEFAYLCASKYGIRPEENTCGWVKGEPRRERYDDIIGPLCGSAGTRYYCTICGKMVGEFQEIVS